MKKPIDRATVSCHTNAHPYEIDLWKDEDGMWYTTIWSRHNVWSDDKGYRNEVIDEIPCGDKYDTARKTFDYECKRHFGE